MCGRFTFSVPEADLIEWLGEICDPAKPALQRGPLVGEGAPALAPRWNIAPTQDVAAVRATPEGRRLAMLRWGLVPWWAEDLSFGAKAINARAETLAERPAFRDAFRERRCLVLADGFYEWERRGGKRVPHFISRRDRAPFALAGLWDRWRGAGRIVESCTIVTTTANATVRWLHERMPVILPTRAYGAWLDARTPPEEARALLVPAPADELVEWEVDPRVNRFEVDDARCVEKVGLF